MKYIALFIIGIAFGLIAVVVASLLEYGLDKQAKVDCIKWSNEAKSKMFAGYYITPWQSDQCKAQGVRVDTPVK